jgi:hypothetical protein
VPGEMMNTEPDMFDVVGTEHIDLPEDIGMYSLMVGESLMGLVEATIEEIHKISHE